MGTTERPHELSYAASGSTTGSYAARFALRLGLNVRGATAIEYAMIAGLVSIVIVGAVTQIGQSVSSFFASIAPYV